MKHYVQVLSITVLLWAAGTVTTFAADEATELDQFFREYLEALFELRPTQATRLGDHRFDHLLDDVSREARERWKDLARRTLDTLPEHIDYPALPRPSQIDYEIFEHALKRTLWLAENSHPFEEDPRTYGRYISGSVYPLLTQSTLAQETNVANGILRMKQIPRVLEAARESLDNPPRVMVETAIRQNQGATRFFEADILTLAGDSNRKVELKAAAAKVANALKDYQEFLENDLLHRSRGDWRLGRLKFAEKLELVLNAGLTADAVLSDAMAEFSRVRHEMYVISRQLWSRYYPDRALPADDEAGRRETIELVLNEVGKDHGRPEDLVDDIKTVVGELKDHIGSRDLLRLPDPDRCQIIEMPEFRRGNSTAYMNSPPPLDPNAVGYYAISPPPSDWDPDRVRSYLEEYNSHMLKILTIHEAYPGHYVQFEYANRHPSLIRKVLSSGVYVEGWAVYTEQTLLDQGYGHDDLRLRLTQLKFYLRAVANAILDHRMHCEKMSDDDALAFLTREAFQSEGEARLKIIRSKQSSTQLSTYFVGRMAHYRLRQGIQREMGDRFSLGAYHEAVLAQGPVPVKYLPDLVRDRLQHPR